MSNYSNSPFGSVPPVTANLLLVNIIMFIATVINQDFMIRTFALFYPASPYFHWWQIITHMFMHGGFWHIFFNMYTLFIFGIVLERMIGSKKFLTFYFIAGLGAVLIHLGSQFVIANVAIQSGDANTYYRLLATPTLGASGAIYGVLIGYAMLNPDATLVLLFPPIPLKAKWWVAIFAVIELATGIFGSNEGVAHFAHLGGMLFGWLLMLWWKKSGRLYRPDEWI
jgi:membrane associated rhomboid family serine protease